MYIYIYIYIHTYIYIYIYIHIYTCEYTAAPSFSALRMPTALRLSGAAETIRSEKL